MPKCVDCSNESRETCKQGDGTRVGKASVVSYQKSTHWDNPPWDHPLLMRGSWLTDVGWQYCCLGVWCDMVIQHEWTRLAEGTCSGQEEWYNDNMMVAKRAHLRCTIPARELGMRWQEVSQIEKRESTRQRVESYLIQLSAPNVHLQVTGYIQDLFVHKQGPQQCPFGAWHCSWWA